MEVVARARAKPQTGRGQRGMTNMTGWIHTRFLATWTNTEAFGRRGLHPPDAMSTIAYNASKGAVVNFTRALAGEWGRHEINVNAIAPGFFPSNTRKRRCAVSATAKI
jgi:NAD(P)-dependent dehydrogenase (short-subunit alcohol dehydrogenase family)